MSAEQGSRSGSPFGRSAVLGMVVVGFVAFVAMLYFIGVGDTGNRDNDGAAHAASNGLNGYSGLTRLLEAQGYEINFARDQGAFETDDLLVLTPPQYSDAEELTELLQDRAYTGRH